MSAVKKKGLSWAIRTGFTPEDLEAVIHLHEVWYGREYGYDSSFAAYVASGLAAFVQGFQTERDRIWFAETGDQIIGSVAVVHQSDTVAQLRWYFVHPDFRRWGLGGALLSEALRFCHACRYKVVFLWTTSELVDAGRLYRRFGLTKVEENTHRLWGKEITEERYERRL